MHKPPQLSPTDAKAKLLIILEEGRVSFTPHCREEMANATATIDDVLNVLENGSVDEKAEWDEKHLNWKYRIVGADIEGETLTAITVIIEVQLMARIITVF